MRAGQESSRGLGSTSPSQAPRRCRTCRSRANLTPMYATFDTRSPDELATEPALVEAHALRRLGDNRATTLAFWTATADPMAYEVQVDEAGAAADQPAAAASVVWFDGPMSPVRVAAARFG